MRRTNIYLDEDQLRALKHLAVEEQQSRAVLVLQALDEFLARRFAGRADWGERLDALVQRIRRRIPADVTPEQIEADITAARDEVRQEHRATRTTSRARSASSSLAWASMRAGASRLTSGCAPEVIAGEAVLKLFRS